MNETLAVVLVVLLFNLGWWSLLFMGIEYFARKSLFSDKQISR